MMKKLLLGIFVILSLFVAAAPFVDAASVWITPANPTTVDTLTGHVSGGSGAYTHYWFKNGQLISQTIGTTSTTSTISPSLTNKGELFDYKVYDYVSGNLLGQTSVTIGNSAPVMNTITPGANTCITGGRSVTISYSASDADNDALTYTINWGDNSANTVTTSTTSTHIYPTAGGTFTVSVSASDGQSTSNVLTLVLNLAVCAGPSTADVILDSQQNNNILNHLPTVVFNGNNYAALPTAPVTVPIGTYTVAYNPQPGFQFLNWTVTGGITVLSATSVNVTGNGNLTAIYQDIQAPTITFVAPTPAIGSTINVNCSTSNAAVTFNVTIADNAGTNASNVQNVTLHLNGQNYTMTGSGASWALTLSLPVGAYSYFVTAQDGSGNTGTSATQTFTVSNANCGGTSYTINLNSRLITSGTATNVGTITFNSISYTLPQTLTVAGNTYPISYTPISGFVFDHWESNMTSGTITFGNPNVSSTTAIVAGNGTIMAVYKIFVNTPPVIGGSGPNSGSSFNTKCSDSMADVVISAVVTDDNGIQSVNAEVDGANYTMSASGSTYSTTVHLSAGTHTYKIIATDISGAVTTSGTIAFTVAGTQCIGGTDSLQVYTQIANNEQANPGEETYVLVNMYNAGNVDIQDVYVKASIPDFAFTRSTGPFDLQPGWNSRQIYFDVPVDAQPGQYDVRVNVFNDNLSRVKYRTLTVLGDGQSVPPGTTIVTPISATNEAVVQENSILPLLLTFILLFLLLIAGIIVAVKRHKKEEQPKH